MIKLIILIALVSLSSAFRLPADELDQALDTTSSSIEDSAAGIPVALQAEIKYARLLVPASYGSEYAVYAPYDAAFLTV
ncbi:hypothetical protein NQ317_005094 [Molorchus minor]|uniref:Uncharacterized protein n=1 Tax=Molorchus minor TaxID=1323400 RepID=A0ABQ9JGW0_9CUCU|nr:hypothetical protein NQ317_005094 [Molorchus minor]